MSNTYRCRQCSAPKAHPDFICEVCGLDPKEEKSIASFGDELMMDFLEETPFEELSLDEKINRMKSKRGR